MSAIHAYDKPLSVEAVEGEVVIRSRQGPVGVSLTPRAAEHTAREMARAALLAADQASQTGSTRD